jgi:hypothetical protein
MLVVVVRAACVSESFPLTHHDRDTHGLRCHTGLAQPYLYESCSCTEDATSVTVTVGQRTIKCPTQLFINGQFVPSSSGETYATFNPATDEVM